MKQEGVQTMSTTRVATKSRVETSDPCSHLPELVRMNYFHGQLLTARDFRTEQDYVREKLKLLNRCLHGYGVLCGLAVRPVPAEEECPPRDWPERERLERDLREAEAELERLKQAGDAERLREMEAALERMRRALEALAPDDPGRSRPHRKVLVECGFALDCHGNEIVVGASCPVDLLSLLEATERARVEQRGATIYLSICFAECGLDSARPLQLADCKTTRGCEATRTREAWKLVASLEPPDEDERCELCCEPCEECCVLLAAVTPRPGLPLEEDDIDNAVRRRFGLYEQTVITGISWVHGATYDRDQAGEILGIDDPNGGIEMRFSRPVRVETLKPGVIDLLRVHGGGGLAAVITHIEGDYVGLPSSGYVDRVRYRNLTGETLQHGDRVLIVVRGSFILDRCCRPVESAHLGGRVPMIEGSPGEPRAQPVSPYLRRDLPDPGGDAAEEPEEERDETCPHPPGGFGAWTTGHGPTFESWFFIS